MQQDISGTNQYICFYLCSQKLKEKKLLAKKMKLEQKKQKEGKWPFSYCPASCGRSVGRVTAIEEKTAFVPVLV